MRWRNRCTNVGFVCCNTRWLCEYSERSRPSREQAARFGGMKGASLAQWAPVDGAFGDRDCPREQREYARACPVDWLVESSRQLRCEGNAVRLIIKRARGLHILSSSSIAHCLNLQVITSTHAQRKSAMLRPLFTCRNRSSFCNEVLLPTKSSIISCCRIHTRSHSPFFWRASDF